MKLADQIKALEQRIKDLEAKLEKKQSEVHHHYHYPQYPVYYYYPYPQPTYTNWPQVWCGTTTGYSVTTGLTNLTTLGNTFGASGWAGGESAATPIA